MKKLRTLIEKYIHKLKKNWFLFQQLVSRDFKERYKGTVFGMGWSVLSPLLQLLVMRLVFTQFFGTNKPFYTTFLFAGVIVFSCYRECTANGMTALRSNADVINKINVPKFLFLLSKNVAGIINFGLTLAVFFIFAAFDGVTFSWRFLLLFYPVICLIILNIGVGFILSAMSVYFRDTTYLYSIFLVLLRYASAIFYDLDSSSVEMQRLFLINPVYDIIKYIRLIVIDGVVPSLPFHLLVLGYPLIFLAIGLLIYKKKNNDFIYYL